MKAIFTVLALLTISQASFATTETALSCQLQARDQAQFGFLDEKSIKPSEDGLEVQTVLNVGNQTCEVRFRQSNESQDGFIQITLKNLQSGAEQSTRTSFDPYHTQTSTDSYIKTERASCRCKLQQ